MAYVELYLVGRGWQSGAQTSIAVLWVTSTCLKEVNFLSQVDDDNNKNLKQKQKRIVVAILAMRRPFTNNILHSHPVRVAVIEPTLQLREPGLRVGRDAPVPRASCQDLWKGHKSWAARSPTSAHLIHLHSHLGARPIMMPILQVRKLKLREAQGMQLPGGGDGIRTLDHVLLDQDRGPQMEGSSDYREYWPQGGKDCPGWESLVKK